MIRTEVPHMRNLVVMESPAPIEHLDFEDTSCIWINPDCRTAASWSVLCRGCAVDLGSVCTMHRRSMLNNPDDDYFCKTCDLTGRQADIVVFVPR